MTVFERETSPDKFSYMVVVRTHTDSSDENFVLNRLGAEGWELVTVAIYGAMRWLYLKKKQ